MMDQRQHDRLHENGFARISVADVDGHRSEQVADDRIRAVTLSLVGEAPPRNSPGIHIAFESGCDKDGRDLDVLAASTPLPGARQMIAGCADRRARGNGSKRGPRRSKALTDRIRMGRDVQARGDDVPHPPLGRTQPRQTAIRVLRGATAWS